VVLLLIVSLTVPAFGANPTAVEETLARMELALGDDVDTTLSPTTGLVTFLSLPRDRQIPLSLVAPATADARARSFLGDWGTAFGVGDGQELELLNASVVDEVGMEHVRFRQIHRGVPITGGELSVHLQGNGVAAVNAKTLPDLAGLEVTPAVSPDEARVAAESDLEAGLGISDARLSEPRLELFNRGLLEGRDGETRLAWFIEATKVDLREFIWIDAENGDVLLQFSQLTDARVRLIFDANDPGDGVFDDLPGTLYQLEGNPPALPPDSDSDAIYAFSGDTYDYFMNEHGRDSYTG
jgi:Zn-dependent metalloprotease